MAHGIESHTVMIGVMLFRHDIPEAAKLNQSVPDHFPCLVSFYIENCLMYMKMEAIRDPVHFILYTSYNLISSLVDHCLNELPHLILRHSWVPPSKERPERSYERQPHSHSHQTHWARCSTHSEANSCNSTNCAHYGAGC